MNTTERLQAIRAKCVSLLETASKRTPGEWEVGPNAGSVTSPNVKGHYKKFVAKSDSLLADDDAAFIASCAGPAEAGWRATIAAIDGLLYMTPGMSQQATINQILTAWEGIDL